MKRKRISLSRLFILAVSTGLLIALLLIFRPESLADIEGRESRDKSPADLLGELTASLAQGRPFECSEAELNGYMASSLSAREGPVFDLFSEVRGVWIRLEEGEFDLVIEREFLGLPTTFSGTFRVASMPEAFRITTHGGRFGRMPVSAPMLNMIRPALENIGRVFEREKEVLSRCEGITITDGWVRLDP